MNKSSVRKKCFTNSYSASATTALPDIGSMDNDKSRIATFERRTDIEQTSTEELKLSLEYFLKLNYIEQYIDANFKHGKCFLNEIKKKYVFPG